MLREAYKRCEKWLAYSSIPVLGQARAGSVVHSDSVSTTSQKLYYSHYKLTAGPLSRVVSLTCPLE